MASKLSLLILAGCAFAGAQEVGPLIDKIDKQVSADRAMVFMRRIWATDRWFTFSKFQETAAYIAATMRELGLEAEVAAAPADGVSRFGHWTMPLAWDVSRATLEVIEPERHLLADYQTVPTSLGMWSGPTPAGGITAEVVWLEDDSPRAVAAAPLKGKMLLTNRNSANLKAALVKAGAVGALNGFSENPALADDRQWVNAWGDKGWGLNQGDTPLLSFSITPRQAESLKKLIRKGAPVRVRAVVDAKLYKGNYAYATALIKGAGNEEVLTLGHIAEQGAHDNATGVAAMMEALATLNRMISDGVLPRPRRGIRMLAMGEMYGSVHYVAVNRDRIRRTVAAMCLDTPAASYDLGGTEFTWHMNPHAASSFIDAFVLKVARDFLGRRNRHVQEAPYMPGTDTWLADPVVGVPTVWPYSGTGVHSHHNSADTPSTVDARSLRDLAVINAAFLYYIADAGDKEARWLADLALNRGYKLVVDAVESGSTAKVTHAAERGRLAIRSVTRLAAIDVDDRVARLEQFAGEQTKRLPLPKIETKPGANLIIRRKGFGLIPLDELPEERREGFPSGAWAVTPQTALFWCDGKRPLSEVIRFTEAELGPQKFDFEGYFRFLARHGYVEILEQ